MQGLAGARGRGGGGGCWTDTLLTGGREHFHLPPLKPESGAQCRACLSTSGWREWGALPEVSRAFSTVGAVYTHLAKINERTQ